ncbi:MAG: DNA mismatch repair endonuclease MutL, partial [Candidatus Hydrogenedentes bacterium]|nr:DNA mismatch repair endonuclease MutL [Candidatus Hydrogenedentota bacterium]
MSPKTAIPSVRVLPENVANKIAAGEVVERPASVVKELVENALDARATRIQVRLVAAGRRTIEVIDDGHGMSEQDALLAIERHTTSKIRKADDLDNISTMGFRGEALASIAAVSKFELVTRRERDDSGTRLRIEGGVLRDVEHSAAPGGTRVTVNRLYFNTPVRAKFLRGITTVLSQCIDIVQRHALVQTGVAFSLTHNDKTLFDIPERASLRERVALIWGLNFLKDLVDLDAELAGFRFTGLIGTPQLTRSQRSHQFFFLNKRPVVNRSLQYGFEDGYRSLVTVGRHPVGMVLVDVHPRLVDVNIHPSKREIRFRDERAARDAVRQVVRDRLSELHRSEEPAFLQQPRPAPRQEACATSSAAPQEIPEPRARFSDFVEAQTDKVPFEHRLPAAESNPLDRYTPPVQTLIQSADTSDDFESAAPSAVYRPMGAIGDAPMQLFDTYLLVPEDDRLLIIDQHALHERLTYDALRADLEDHDYQAQQLAVPLLVDAPPSHAKLLESNLALF